MTSSESESPYSYIALKAKAEQEALAAPTIALKQEAPTGPIQMLSGSRKESLGLTGKKEQVKSGYHCRYARILSSTRMPRQNCLLKVTTPCLTPVCTQFIQRKGVCLVLDSRPIMVPPTPSQAAFLFLPCPCISYPHLLSDKSMLSVQKTSIQIQCVEL
ncbi:hypothetical protein RRG08_000619 [Elysia crispata]|uniref:Uncharacterized protein n=1 Tax=Elysia crispata TaxID=231223 RepID=A0AAE0Y8P1_9GAST|nr:hypothetical protein RRG08_000619 [Elysia crispata]